jgi:hypothetical protein
MYLKMPILLVLMSWVVFADNVEQNSEVENQTKGIYYITKIVRLHSF